MDLYEFTIVMVRLQGVILMFSLIYNLGYAYQDLYPMFHFDAYQVDSQFRIMSSWMFVVRQIIDLIGIFIFFKYAQNIASILVSGVNKIQGKRQNTDEKSD